jgi:hypothetical protein
VFVNMLKELERISETAFGSNKNWLGWLRNLFGL